MLEMSGVPCRWEHGSVVGRHATFAPRARDCPTCSYPRVLSPLAGRWEVLLDNPVYKGMTHLLYPPTLRSSDADDPGLRPAETAASTHDS
jgi:hypothetical protein